MPTLKDINYNLKKELHQVSENEKAYLFPIKLLNDLKSKSVGILGEIYVEDWYNGLSNKNKKLVKIIKVKIKKPAYQRA